MNWGIFSLEVPMKYLNFSMKYTAVVTYHFRHNISLSGVSHGTYAHRTVHYLERLSMWILWIHKVSYFGKCKFGMLSCKMGGQKVTRLKRMVTNEAVVVRTMRTIVGAMRTHFAAFTSPHFGVVHNQQLFMMHRPVML